MSNIKQAEAALATAIRELEESEATLVQRGRELNEVQEKIRNFPIGTGDAGKLGQLKAKEQALDGICDTLIKQMDQGRAKVKRCREDLSNVESMIEGVKKQIGIVERRLGPSGDTAYRRRNAEREIELCNRLDENDRAEMQRLTNWLTELRGE